MNELIPVSPIRSVTVIGALLVSSASLAFSAIEGSCGRGLLDFLRVRSAQSAEVESDASHNHETDLTGHTEAIPNRVFRIMAYNDWPLLQIAVHEGQRLTWRRENGTWVGDNDVLTTQNETPAEIDGVMIEAENAAAEVRIAQARTEMAVIEAETALAQADVRERNAKQELDRMTGLHRRDAESVEAYRRAENVWMLAVAEKEKARKVVALEKKLAETEVKLAESRKVQAENELDLANFKRDMSWGKVPVHLIKGAPNEPRQVVVTKVAARIGDQPPRAGDVPVWVEVVDDSRLFVRVGVKPEVEDTLQPEAEFRVSCRGRSYPARLVSILPVVDRETQETSVLLEVENTDRRLKIGAAVQVDFTTNQAEGAAS